MKTVAIIPTRYESSRFPGKPLALIKGKPMIFWVYEQVRQTKNIQEIYVATDDIRIGSVCDFYKIPVIMTSKAHPTGTDRMCEVSKNIDADLYINIQGDEPLIEPQNIEKIISYFEIHKNVSVINTMTKINESKEIYSNSVVKVAFNSHNSCIYLSRSPIPCGKTNENVQFYRHLGLYGMTKQALNFYCESSRGRLEIIEDIEMLRFIENGISIDILSINTNSVGVDLPSDIQKVEQIMDTINSKYEGC